MSWHNLFVLSLFAYLIGSLPFGLMIANVKNCDIRKKGSGNIGASNVYRVMGPGYGICVFILDVFKGFIPTFLCMILTNNAWLHIAVGLCSVLGHTFSIFAKFKGGKGVATSAGMLLALHPLVFFIMCPATLIAIKLIKIVAPCSIAAAIITPLLLSYLNAPIAYITFTGVLAIFIIWTHKANIKRLINGEEISI